MGARQNINGGWVFHDGFSEALTREPAPGADVTLPHNAVDLPLSYFDEKSYQRAFCYQKTLAWRSEFAGKEISLEFDGAMADAAVYCNGEKIAAHRDGYTPFSARLTGRLKPSANLIAVKIDGSEHPEIPPFGGPIDYLTYAGIYRDVWLKVTTPVFIDKIKAEAHDVLSDVKGLSVRCAVGNPGGLAFTGTVKASLRDKTGRELGAASASLAGAAGTLHINGLAAALWDLDNPTLYELTVTLSTEHGEDAAVSHVGFRTAEFTPKGFRLNGKPLKIRGLNRHQAYPYVGYALGRRAQERDAEILKHELGCNLVRTSHYPQSPWFLDHCDRIGLLVFEEIPGWQHIGDAAWKRAAVENVRAMIERDWNHPSIVIWGVRINESADDHDFYAETNRLAHELDATRQTGGVRYIADSELLEDVYTMNDFVLGSEETPGANRGRIALRGQREVTGLKRDVPYLITEFNGHMYPTKRGDQEQRQAEHALRHLQVLNAAYADESISGCIGWCMADYNTHKDFGSGDRICHHGVADIFREPKFAGFAYASQGEPGDAPVLQAVTVWARGERNIGGVLPLIVLTNCEEVELAYGDSLTKRVGPDRENFPHLPHPPVVIDHRHFSAEELGLWGMAWHGAKLTGLIGGRAVKTQSFVAEPLPTTLALAADTLTLSAAPKDATRVIVRALDQAGNKLMFLDEVVTLSVLGPAKVIGPTTLALKGGTTGFWLETTGGAGAIEVEATCPRFPSASASLQAV